MICTQCGRNSAPDIAFCPYCGARLGVQPPEGAGMAQPHVAYTAPRVSTLAILSIVLGALGFCTGITGLVGIVLGVVALKQIGASRGQMVGQPAAIVGIVTSGISLLLIPIFAAILFPVFAQARERARETACMSNVKQIALGAMMYCQDYDEALPLARNWTEALLPYTKSQTLFKCPAAMDIPYGYAYNSGLDHVSMADVTAPNALVMLFESDTQMNGSGGVDSVVARHRHRSALGFCDGHVRMTPFDRVRASTVWEPGATATPGSTWP